MRLTSDIWVSAYRMRLEAKFIPVYVAAKGDPNAGAVLIKCATLDGNAVLWGREPGPDFTPVWTRLAAGPEAEVDARVAKRRAADPDLWVLEVEDRSGTALLDEDGLG